MKVKRPCGDCGKQIRNVHIYRDKFLCWNCYREKGNMINFGGEPLTLEKALDRVYEIRGNITKKGLTGGFRNFPQVLIGHKVKLVLVK